MPWKKEGLLLLVVALVSIGLTSYLYLTSAPPDELIGVTLTIPAKTWGYLWSYAGVEAGIYAEEGIDLEIVVSRPSAIAVQAVIEGSAQFTATEAASVAMLQGAELKIVGYGQVDTRFFLISRPEIQSVEDLRGRRIAVARAHTLTAVVTTEILKIHGLDADTDLEIIGVGSSEERLAALQHGSIDAAVFVPPDNIVAEESGLNVLLESADLLTRKIITPIVTSQRMIDEEPETVGKMVKATVRSVRYLLEQREEAIQIAMDVFDVEEDFASQAYDLVKGAWGYSAPTEDVQKLFEVQNGFLDEPVEFDIQDWMDYTFLNDVLEELGMEPVLTSLQHSQPRSWLFLALPSDMEH